MCGCEELCLLVQLRKSGSRLFYGYWIIIIAFLCNFIYAGVGFFAFSLFVKPLENAFLWSRGSIMAAFTLSYIISGWLPRWSGDWSTGMEQRR